MFFLFSSQAWVLLAISLNMLEAQQRAYCTILEPQFSYSSDLRIIQNIRKLASKKSSKSCRKDSPMHGYVR